MRICFFADADSIHTVRWCKYFHSLGHEIHLISFKKSNIEGIHCHLVNAGKIGVSGGNWKVLLKYGKVKKLLNKIQPDIFHAHYATSYGITGALCGFRPFVITALGTDLLISPKKSFIYRILLRFALKKAQWVTVMSDQMKIEAMNLGASEDKLMVLPFGVDPIVFNKENRITDENCFVITSTRNFEDVYRIDDVLNAFATFNMKVKNSKLNLIGDGSLRKSLEDLTDRLHLRDSVQFFGKIKQMEIAAVLKKSHVFISASESDGNNISLNEAMACGTFSIATNIPANRQWIDHDENGLLFEVGAVDELKDCLLMVYHNYSEMQSKAIPLSEQKIKEKGIWSNNMDKMLEQYMKLIA